MTEYKVQVYEDRTVWRKQDGKFHRLDGPAVEWKDGSKFWYVNGKRHRLDGPAVKWNNGDKEWWRDGIRHRSDGPAFEGSDGCRSWWKDGKLHRIDGPAVERDDGYKEWRIEGIEYSEEEFDEKVKEMNYSCEGKIVEIDGKKYKLTKV